MAEELGVQVPRVSLGTQGFEVSKLGFGCLGLTGTYNAPVPDEVGFSIIKHAYDNGITFFDTSDIYGPHENEILVGKAMKQFPREKIQLATKFGIVSTGTDRVVINGSPEYACSCCEASLKRLGMDYIDLYYQHRIDTSIPIEETMGELNKWWKKGKLSTLGYMKQARRPYGGHIKSIPLLPCKWSGLSDLMTLRKI